jgi:hypothetical protein
MDVGRRDLADQRLARQFADRTGVVGHAAHRGHARVQLPAQGRPCCGRIRWCRQMDVRVDQAGDDVLAAQVDDLRPTHVYLSIRQHRRNALALDHDAGPGAGRRAGPVDQHGVAVDGARGFRGDRGGGKQQEQRQATTKDAAVHRVIRQDRGMQHRLLPVGMPVVATVGEQCVRRRPAHALPRGGV